MEWKVKIGNKSGQNRIKQNEKIAKNRIREKTEGKEENNKKRRKIRRDIIEEQRQE